MARVPTIEDLFVRRIIKVCPPYDWAGPLRDIVSESIQYSDPHLVFLTTDDDTEVMVDRDVLKSVRRHFKNIEWQITQAAPKNGHPVLAGELGRDLFVYVAPRVNIKGAEGQ